MGLFTKEVARRIVEQERETYAALVQEHLEDQKARKATPPPANA